MSLFLNSPETLFSDFLMDADLARLFFPQTCTPPASPSSFVTALFYDFGYLCYLLIETICVDSSLYKRTLVLLTLM